MKLTIHGVSINFRLLRQPIVVTLCYAILALYSDLHADSTSANGSQDSEMSLAAEQRRDLPLSINRLFGESLPFPNPAETGFDLYVLAMHDTYANTTGGANRGGGIMGNLFLSLTLNTERAGLWSNGKFVFEGIGVYGRQPSRVVRDYQFTSAIDAPDTIEPYQLFYEHSFFSDRVNIIAGIHDYSLQFGMLGYGWDFVHSSFWTPSTMTQFWWSFYPSTGLGSRARLKISDTAYLMAGVYDGNPTNQANYRKIHWGLSKRDGAHSLMELGISEDREGQRPYKLAIGGWYNSGEFDSADGGTMSFNYGTYAVGQALLYTEDESYERGLGGFFQLGQADNAKNFNTWYFGAGLRYKGLLGSRPEDILALGWGRAQIGSTYRNTNPGTESFEGNTELTYRAVIRPWLTVQPSVQLITNPGANADYDNAVILYLRSEVLL